jgi:hypothetical protein
MAEMIARLKAPPANAPATISARFEMNLQRLEDKIDETKEALQTENRGIAKNQAALNEQNKEILKQNKEILHLLNIQRINEKIARNEALASGQDSGARLPQEGLDWQGSRCNGSRKEGLAALSEAAASEAAAALPCQRQASQPCRLPTPSESVSLAGQGLAALSQAQQPCQPTPSESALAALRVATPTAGPPPTHALATEAQPPTYSLADLWYMAVDPQPQQLPVEPGSCRCTPPHLGACPKSKSNGAKSNGAAATCGVGRQASLRRARRHREMQIAGSFKR